MLTETERQSWIAKNTPSIRYAVCYAYPTSEAARHLNRTRQGCWYVAGPQGHYATGPLPTYAEAQDLADILNKEGN